MPATLTQARARAGEHPRDAHALAALARAERAAGHPGAELIALERAASRWPSSPIDPARLGELLVARARELRGLGRSGAAERDLARAVAVWPGARPLADNARREQASLAAGGDQMAAAADALAVIDWAHERAAVSVRAPAAIAQLEVLGAVAAARGLAEQRVAEDPSDVGARLDLVRLDLGLKQVARARLDAEDAIYAATDRPGTMLALADLLERAGQRRMACALLARRLAYGSDDASLAALAACLERDGQHEGAVALLRARK
jgi:hypothetical protein